VVVSSDAIGILAIKMIAPITEWEDHYARNLWHIRIVPDRTRSDKAIRYRCPSSARSLDRSIHPETRPRILGDNGGNRGCNRGGGGV